MGLPSVRLPKRWLRKAPALVVVEVWFLRHRHIRDRNQHLPNVIQLDHHAVTGRLDYDSVAPREPATLIAAMSTLTKLHRIALVFVHDLPPSGV